jgi:hypothetical protein
MLLGLLNDADTVLHRLERAPESRAAEPAGPLSLLHPTDTAPTALAPADPAPAHEDQHAGAIETPATDSSPVIHADAAAAIGPQDTRALPDDAPSGGAPATLALASSSELSSFSAPADHAPSTGASSLHGGGLAAPSVDLGTSIHNLADTISGIVDTALATVSSTVAGLSATVGQLTSTLLGTVSHVADGLTGTVTSITHDAPATGLLEPLTTDLLGPTASATDLSGAAQHDVSLLDTAGAIPTSLLHPIPLQLGFLGQPTMDGHEPHDGAFSALGGHHF